MSSPTVLTFTLQLPKLPYLQSLPYLEHESAVHDTIGRLQLAVRSDLRVVNEVHALRITVVQSLLQYPQLLVSHVVALRMTNNREPFFQPYSRIITPSATKGR